MALQQINGNQISDLTDATITSLKFKNTNSVLQLPGGTTAQRPTGIAYGTLRFNTTEDKVECYVTNSDGQGTDGWTLVGAGGPHVGTKDTSYIRTNSASIDENITIGPVANGGAQYTNAGAYGPVEIASGYTLTIENGATFTVVGDQPDNYVYSNVTVTDVFDAQLARMDVSAIREDMDSRRLSLTDTMVMIDYTNASSLYLANVSNNFDINLLGLPTTSIGLGGADNMKSFSFTIMYYNGSNRYRPTGNIYLNGSYITGSVWQGGGVPATLNANRHVVVGVSLIRISEYTDFTGGTSTYWRSYINFNEFA
jgi:hypothetical protein